MPRVFYDKINTNEISIVKDYITIRVSPADIFFRFCCRRCLDIFCSSQRFRDGDLILHLRQNLPQKYDQKMRKNGLDHCLTSVIKKDHFSEFYDIFRVQQTVQILYREDIATADEFCHVQNCFQDASFEVRPQRHIPHQD